VCYAGYWSHSIARRLQMLGRSTRVVRPFVATLLVLQFSAHCRSQPLPSVLPLNRFGTKNTYNNTDCGGKRSEVGTENVDETDFCCPPVQVLNLHRVSKNRASVIF